MEWGSPLVKGRKCTESVRQKGQELQQAAHQRMQLATHSQGAVTVLTPRPLLPAYQKRR